MCNDYRLEVDAAAIAEDFDNLNIKITDVAPIVRTIEGARGAGDLVQRRWSWPGPTGKPVYNFRSDGREFASGRCLIVADGFYEFTTPEDPKKKRKDKWLFTKKDEPLFCIAGIWRTDPKVGEAFTMLTMPPGPDIAPYHDRQICVLERSAWADWLDPTISAKEILRELAAGTLHVEQVVEMVAGDGASSAVPASPSDDPAAFQLTPG